MGPVKHRVALCGGIKCGLVPPPEIVARRARTSPGIRECPAVPAGTGAARSNGGSWTNDGEVLVLLGECELELHRREEALAAWGRVPPASPFFNRAAVLRATHLINSGRYTPAEEVLLQALSRSGQTPPYDLERTLARLYRFEGRFDEVRRLVRASWFHSPAPAELLKEVWTHDNSPMPVEAWKRLLDAADHDDDRVWLGLAHQAILTGRFEDAAGWLNRCFERRADDPPLWQARLELAMATGDSAGCWTAVGRLSADRFDSEAVHRIRVWLAANAGDTVLEQQELGALLEVAPGTPRHSSGWRPSRLSQDSLARPKSSSVPRPRLTAPRTNIASCCSKVAICLVEPKPWDSSRPRSARFRRSRLETARGRPRS